MQILILENDPITAAQIACFTVQCGHSVAGFATDAEEAIHLARTVPLDLLLADIDLGGEQDGIDAAVAIASDTGIKTVFITGSTDPASRNRAQHAWPLRFLVKPFDLQSFSQTLALADQMLRFRRPGLGFALPKATRAA